MCIRDSRHPVAVLILLLLLLRCFLVSAVSSIFPTLGSGLANALSGTSYASEDTDLLGVDEDVYKRQILNEMYSKDISKKVHSSYLLKAQKGQFTGCLAPFG